MGGVKLFNRGEEIEFFCCEEDWDVIARPVPATKHIPEWFKSLPPKLGNGAFNDSTVKRCMPFLDAMSAGWLIPLAADIYIEASEDGQHLLSDSKFPKTLLQEHSPQQISSEKSPHPLSPRRPLKWLNYWFIKVPKEFSLLFVAPLEREEKRFRCFSGLVDAPYPEQEYVNFPFTILKDNFKGMFEKGTPLVQVIPVRKDSLLSKATFRKQTARDKAATELLRRQRAAHESHYRDYMRQEVK